MPAQYACINHMLNYYKWLFAITKEEEKMDEVYIYIHTHTCIHCTYIHVPTYIHCTYVTCTYMHKYLHMDVRTHLHTLILILYFYQAMETAMLKIQAAQQQHHVSTVYIYIYIYTVYQNLHTVTLISDSVSVCLSLTVCLSLYLSVCL